MKKGLCSLWICVFLFMTWNASACSLFYFGGDYTDDGANLFVRVEDGNVNDDTKLFLVSPAGMHKAGEKYECPYGFTWTFTHDSYKYVSRRDILYGEQKEELPDFQSCEEAGTNEYGFTLTATQSVYANAKIEQLDPYGEEGVSEPPLATILLSECATAREAVTLLKGIIESTGMSNEGISAMLCDQNEQWYVEAHASHYFLAVRLPRGVAFFQANVSVLGLLDLDDTENIVASDGLIELAQRAGTFVGDAEKNIIDYRRSFNDYLVKGSFGAEITNNDDWRWQVSERKAVSLNYLEGTDVWNNDNVLEDNDYIMTNIGEDGSIVPLHNNLKVTGTVSLDHLLEMLKLYPLGYSENVESHLYRFYPEEETELGIVEWASMDNNQYNVFVPDYPVLLTDTWKGFQVEIPETVLQAKNPEYWVEEIGLEQAITELKGERPDTKDCYEMKGVFFGLYYIMDWSGLWHVFPEGWEESYIDVFSALSNYLTYSDPGEEAIALTKERFAAMQQDFETRFAEQTVRLRKEKNGLVRREIATREAAGMAEEAQALALGLYRHFVYGEPLP